MTPDYLTFMRLAILSIVLSLVASNSLMRAQGSYPQASTRLLNSEDLRLLDKAELKIMRNEIFARYGYKFKTKDMQEYFARQSWYRPAYADVTSMLSDVEKKNVDIIKRYEASASSSTQAKESVAQVQTNLNQHENDMYRLATSRILIADDLEGLNLIQLKLLRNEIYARRGYIFKNPALTKHFESQGGWYKGSKTDVSSLLTKTEKQNINLIKGIEKSRRTNERPTFEGRLVDRIIPYYNSQFAPIVDGFAVIVFAGTEAKWEIRQLSVELLVESIPQSEEGSYDDQRVLESQRDALNQQELLAGVSGEVLASGIGALPTISTGDEGWLRDVELDRKILCLTCSDRYWGDLRLGLGPHGDETDLIALPSNGKPGRVGAVTIRKVIARDDLAMWFIDGEGKHRYLSATSSFTYDPPKEEFENTVCMGSAFAAMRKDGAKKAWFLYSESMPLGNVIAIPADETPKMQTQSCDNDYEEFTAFAFVSNERELKYLIDINKGAVYRFPQGTHSLDDGTFSIPSRGTIWLDWCGNREQLITIVNENEEEVESAERYLLK